MIVGIVILAVLLGVSLGVTLALLGDRYGR
jgi:hypothetical protein